MQKEKRSLLRQLELLRCGRGGDQRSSLAQCEEVLPWVCPPSLVLQPQPDTYLLG